MLSTLFKVSIALNLILLIAGYRFISRKGGINYLVNRWLKFWYKESDRPSYYSTYYFRRVSLMETLSIKPTDVVFLGDSLTDEAEWAELFEETNVKNRGIAGDTTRGLFARLDTILEARPKTILIMIGINDLLNEQRDTNEICESYQQILREIQDKSPQTVVIIQSVLPINAELLGRNPEIEIIEINKQLKSLAEQFSYQYVDLFSKFVDASNNLDSRYSLDGVHLNGKGYELWQQILRPYLEN